MFKEYPNVITPFLNSDTFRFWFFLTLSCFPQSKYSIFHHMMQYFIIYIFIITTIIIGIWIPELCNVLWRGFKPSNSLSEARDYARSAVTSFSKQILIVAQNMLFESIFIFFLLGYGFQGRPSFWRTCSFLGRIPRTLMGTATWPQSAGWPGATIAMQRPSWPRSRTSRHWKWPQKFTKSKEKLKRYGNVFFSVSYTHLTLPTTPYV